MSQKYRYFKRSMSASSSKYGVCEICKEHVTNVHIQIEEREYKAELWTQDKCHTLFGHEHCLDKKRKKGTILCDKVDLDRRRFTIISLDRPKQ